MKILAHLLENPALIGELMKELNDVAQEADPYEFGLPMFGAHDAALREQVYRWIAKVEKAMAESEVA